jgi:periplasmic protein TonB
MKHRWASERSDWPLAFLFALALHLGVLLHADAVTTPSPEDPAARSSVESVSLILRAEPDAAAGGGQVAQPAPRADAAETPDMPEPMLTQALTPKVSESRRAKRPTPRREPHTWPPDQQASRAAKKRETNTRDPASSVRSGQGSANGPGTHTGAALGRGEAPISGAVDRGARPLAGNPRPDYPRLARERGYQGRVVIRVTVLPDGRVGQAELAQGTGYALLDQSAMRAVSRWRFAPAQRAGKPTAATIAVPVVFRLEEG